jgi:hypothetical protein
MVPHPTPSATPERVGFGPPPDWIADREVDFAYKPPVETPVAMLLDDHQHHATRHESYHRVVQRLETISAVQKAAQWRCEFDPATQFVTIHSLSVRRGDRASEHAEFARLRFLQREENLERYILDGMMSVVVLLEDVRVGDVVDTSFSIRTKARVFPHNFALLTAVPLECYTRMFHLSVRFPKGHGMRWQTDSQKITLNERDADGETEWSWKVENFAPRQPELQMPSWHFHGRFIQITDFPSWQAVATGLISAWEEKFEDTMLVRATAEIAGEPAPSCRVERALRLVQDDIRYLSVNTELGGQVPANPGTVLQRRFGDCKDKVFLLVHLLRRLGVSARPVLVHSHFRHHVEQFLPTPGVFNHAIIEYELAGERRWIDATIPLQGGGPMGRSLPVFGMGLPISPDTTDLEPLASTSSSGSAYDLTETFRLEKSSSPLHLYVTIVATGSYADGLRQKLTFDGGAATATGREQFYQQVYSKLRRHADLEWRDNRERNELVLAEAYVLPEAIVAAGEPGVCGFGVCAHAIQSMLSLPDNDRRKHPLALPFPINVKQRIEFEFQTLFRMHSLRETTRTEEFSFQLIGTWTHPRAAFEFDLETHEDHVSPEHFNSHRNKVRKIWPFTQFSVLIPKERSFSRLPDPSDSLLPPVTTGSSVDDSNDEAGTIPPPDAIAPCLPSLSPDQRSSRTSKADRENSSKTSRVPRQLGTSSNLIQSGPSASAIARNTMIGVFVLVFLIRAIFLILSNPPR